MAFHDRQTGAFSCAMPDQHHPPVATLGCGGVDQRPCDGLLVLALAEMDHRDAVGLGELVHLTHVAVADLPERRRGWDRISPLPAQELTHPTHRLQLRYIGLQEDPVHRPAGERHMITK
ncbi:MAG TPA: hypothetical protein VGJ07_12040 [Rugosimonospora sp.]